MCQDCNCGDVQAIAIDGEVHHPHHHSHNHHNGHTHTHAPVASITLEAKNGNNTYTLPVHTSLISKNDRLAERNRGYFQAKKLLVLNILSSPGSGKTALIERTVHDLSNRPPTAQQQSLEIGVIVGDLETDNDAQRLRKAGAPAVQITTGTTCHLEADMVAQAMAKLDLDTLDVLIIENVGNMVCPAVYDLGETLRVALLSVTEGEDKPLKYPTLFKTADIVIINKIDIAEVVGFNRELAIANIQRIAPQATLFEVSARTGQGMETWYTYLTNAKQQIKP
jgi:hydrogenase nickel incorporation protein HypB